MGSSCPEDKWALELYTIPSSKSVSTLIQHNFRRNEKFSRTPRKLKSHKFRHKKELCLFCLDSAHFPLLATGLTCFSQQAPAGFFSVYLFAARENANTALPTASPSRYREVFSPLLGALQRLQPQCWALILTGLRGRKESSLPSCEPRPSWEVCLILGACSYLKAKLISGSSSSKSLEGLNDDVW